VKSSAEFDRAMLRASLIEIDIEYDCIYVIEEKVEEQHC
jgi:hypothetical protein